MPDATTHIRNCCPVCHAPLSVWRKLAINNIQGMTCGHCGSALKFSGLFTAGLIVLALAGAAVIEYNRAALPSTALIAAWALLLVVISVISYFGRLRVLHRREEHRPRDQKPG